MEAKKFKNFTNESFSWKWNGIEHSFPSGMEIFLEADKALHFAKHLIDRELNRTNTPTNNLSERARLEKLCFPTDEVVSSEEAIDINEKAKAKVKKASKKKVEEEEFADLNA